MSYTVIAPAYFMENLWNPWNVASLARGRFPSSIPPAREIQQVSIGDVIQLATHVIVRREEFAGERITVAADSISAFDAVEIITRQTGRHLDIDTHPSGGPLPLFAWLNRVGYAIDVDALRRRFPTIRWHRFEEWVPTQDWSVIA